MPTHGCIKCPEKLNECCICKGHQHGSVNIPASAILPMPRCLKIIDVFDEPHRCLNNTDGFRAYCDVHMPLLSRSSESHVWSEWRTWLYLILIIAFLCLGFWAHLWQWLRE